MTVTVPAPRFIDIDGKRFLWRELLQRRRERSFAPLSACRLESFSHLRGLLRPLVPFSSRLGSCRIASAKVR
jgi:hypothetical protein